jgi:uncharacterized protein YqeY
MSLQETIDQDLKGAMIQKKELVVSVLRMLKSALHNQVIAKKKKKLSDEETLGIILSQAKKCKDSIEAFKKGSRDDLVEKEEQELKIIKQYLPKQLSSKEINKIVQEVIGQVGDEKNFGKVMGQVMGRVKGRADGNVITQIVKESLES